MSQTKRILCAPCPTYISGGNVLSSECDVTSDSRRWAYARQRPRSAFVIEDRNQISLLEPLHPTLDFYVALPLAHDVDIANRCSSDFLFTIG